MREKATVYKISAIVVAALFVGSGAVAIVQARALARGPSALGANAQTSPWAKLAKAETKYCLGNNTSSAEVMGNFTLVTVNETHANETRACTNSYYTSPNEGLLFVTYNTETQAVTSILLMNMIFEPLKVTIAMVPVFGTLLKKVTTLTIACEAQSPSTEAQSPSTCTTTGVAFQYTGPVGGYGNTSGSSGSSGSGGCPPGGIYSNPALSAGTSGAGIAMSASATVYWINNLASTSTLIKNFINANLVSLLLASLLSGVLAGLVLAVALAFIATLAASTLCSAYRSDSGSTNGVWFGISWGLDCQSWGFLRVCWPSVWLSPGLTTQPVWPGY